MCASYVALNHEMWRDEMQAYLVSRDSKSLFELFVNLKYEGKPILWYILIRFSNTIYNSVYSMQATSIIFSTISVYVFIKYSPFSIWQKILYCFGFFQLYEFSVLSRDYCLQPVFLFLICALYKNRCKNYIFISILIILLGFTNPLAFIASSSLFIGLLFNFVFFQNRLVFNTNKIIIFTTLTTLGLLAAFFDTLPWADIGHDANNLSPFFGWNFDYFLHIKWLFILGFIALPVPDIHFWDGSIFLSAYFSELYIFPIILLLMIYTAYLLRNNISLLIAFLTFLILFILFNYSIYHTGSQRHASIIFLFWISIVWMAELINLKNKYSIISWLFTGILMIQFVGSAQAVINELKFKFSDGYNLAIFLKDEGYLGDEYVISAYPDWAGLSSLGYLPAGTKFYYYHGRLFNTWNIGDSRRLNSPGLEKLACEALQLSAAAHKKVLVILTKQLYEMSKIFKKMEPIYMSSGESVVEEDYMVFKIDELSKDKFTKCDDGI